MQFLLTIQLRQQRQVLTLKDSMVLNTDTELKTYEGLHNMYKKRHVQRASVQKLREEIMLGSFVLSSGYYDAYYLKALRVKALIKKAFDEAFAKI